jgi:hypothetical protein
VKKRFDENLAWRVTCWDTFLLNRFFTHEWYMLRRESLFLSLLLFVTAACHKHEKVNSNGSNDVISEKKAESWELIDFPFPCSAPVTVPTEYVGPIIHNLLGKKQDSSVSFIDAEYDSLAVAFNEIPGGPPYRLETRRLVQEDPNQYLPALEQEMILNEIRSSGLETPFGILMLRQEHLPGERVTWRISSQNGEVLKEAICCPNPAIIKNSSGEKIMEVALIFLFKPTTYVLVFPPRKENIDFVVTVGTKQSKGTIPAGDLKSAAFEPVLKGVHGGMSKIELHSNNESYHVELPWGTEIITVLSRVKRDPRFNEPSLSTVKNESQQLRNEQPPAAQKNNPQECVEQIDSGIEIINVTEELAMKMEMMDLYYTDPGFAKWCILFHDIPGDPPYSFQQKRLLQPLADQYYLYSSALSPEKILDSKNRNLPACLVVSTRGYLLGEKVTLRLSANDAYREITFVPRPLFLKNATGKILAKFTLVSAEPVGTFYNMNICGVGEQEKYKFISYSGKELLTNDHQGPIEGGYGPGVIGQWRGIAKVVLQFEDGSRHSIKIPWGYELLDYKLGNM